MSTADFHPPSRRARNFRSLVIRDVSVTVSFAGELTADNVTLMRLHLLTLVCDDGPDEIIVDLSGISSVDAAGVEPLIEAYRLQMARGASLRLGGISGPVAHQLERLPRSTQIPGRYVSLVRPGDAEGQKAPAVRDMRVRQPAGPGEPPRETC